MRLRVPQACRASCELCAGKAVIDADALPQILQHARETNQGRVYLQGTDLTLNVQLEATVRSARAETLQVALIENGAGIALPGAAEKLRSFGVASVFLSFPAITRQEPATGQPPVEWKNRLRVLLSLARTNNLTVGTHVALTPISAAQVPALLRVQSHLAIRELLVSEEADSNGAHPLEAAAALGELERFWRAANLGQVHLRVIGFETTRHVNPVLGEPAPACDGALVELIRREIPLPAARSGIRMLGADGGVSGLRKLPGNVQEVKELALELAARKCPVVDLPRCLGGTQLAAAAASSFVKSDACPSCGFDKHCAGAAAALELAEPAALRAALRPLPTWYPFQHPHRILVIPSQERDPVVSISTLPALAVALKKRGAEVEIVSPWAALWDPTRLPPPGRNGYVPAWTGMTGIERWMETHDLRTFDLVITSDLKTASFILATGLLAATAHIVVTDFHMLQGMNEFMNGLLAPGKRAKEGGWWPSKQLILESAFPGHAQLYLNYGVPLEQIAWRPFPLYPGHFPPGGDVHGCPTIFSGGEHLRDLDTLRAATALLADPAVHVVDLYAFGERFPGNAHLRHCGNVGPQEFYQALAKGRFVVLPLREEKNCAAGITVLTMALMAGRPVVASSIAAVRDYICHDVEGLLVPPGDAPALATAIARLDSDPALLSSLAAGARAAGQRLSTEYWADEIVSAGSPLLPVKTPGGWRNW